MCRLDDNTAAPEVGSLHHISLDLGHVHAGISLALGLPYVSTLASIGHLQHRNLVTSRIVELLFGVH